MMPVDPATVERILIRANNWIGDVVMISPAVRAIREHFTGARIAILAKGPVLDALRGNPHFDDVIEFDVRRQHAGVIGRYRLVRHLRSRRFDLAVLFQKAFEAAALAFMAGARTRVGYATDHRGALLTHPLPPPAASMHHVEQFLGIARALGCRVRDPLPFFHLSEADREGADFMLRQAGGVPIIAIHPGASKPARAWHAERFAELARRLARRLNGRVLLLGGDGDRVLLEGIAARLPSGLRLAPDRPLPIGMMGGVLERCRLFIGNDSGPMHIAAALGLPTVALFGPGSPERTAPMARPGHLAVVGKAYPCSPCRQDFFRECPPSPSGKPFCLEEIQVAEVEEAALSLLGSVASRRAGPAEPATPPGEATEA